MTDSTAYSDKIAAIPPDGAARQLDFQLAPWIAASVLQKAIRRGESELAVAAARAYARTRGRGVWRRLLIVAFEDISIGAPEAVLETVDLCASALTRKERMPEPNRLAILVRRLANAPKDRAPDHLLTTATFSPRLDHSRRVAAARSKSEHLAVVADASMPVVERALAANLALGLDESGRTRTGDLAADALFQVYRNQGVPTDLVAATRAAAKLTGELITMMTPLLWLEAEKTVDRPVLAQCVPPSPSLDGVPAYSLDKHTAVGKAAILHFARANVAVRDALAGAAPADRAGAVACMAIFHTESSATAARRMWDGALELERLGVEADMFKAGAHPEAADAVLKAARDNLNDLHVVRAELFSRRRS